MKSVKLILMMAFAAISFSAMAQVNYDDPKYAKWGANAEERKQNMLNRQYLGEAVDNRQLNVAAGYLKILLDKCPAASLNIYTDGAKLYKLKINSTEDEEQKAIYIDSLLHIYDVRLANYADHSKYGADYILDRKVREMLNYRPEDRSGIRKVFVEAIKASADKNDGKPNLELTTLYFGNLCDDFKVDSIAADLVIAEYDRLSPAFDGVESEEDVELKNQFESAFGTSGAASCENLEALFSKKLEAAPEDEALLNQAVTLMSRANCDSDFFFQTAEKFYAIKPSSETALFLAQGFQNRSEFDKAMKYLEEALAVEKEPAEREKLYVRIGLISFQTKKYDAAAAAAKEIKNINPENGYAYFILGQCYASSANCAEIKCQACYWAAYDMMSQAVSLLTNEPSIQESAQKMMQSFRAAFPTKEECFFAELQAGARYTVTHGFAAGVSTTVRYR